MKYKGIKQGPKITLKYISKLKPLFPKFLYCSFCNSGFINDTCFRRVVCPNGCLEGGSELEILSSVTEVYEKIRLDNYVSQCKVTQFNGRNNG